MVQTTCVTALSMWSEEGFQKEGGILLLEETGRGREVNTPRVNLAICRGNKIKKWKKKIRIYSQVLATKADAY